MTHVTINPRIQEKFHWVGYHHCRQQVKRVLIWAFSRRLEDRDPQDAWKYRRFEKVSRRSIRCEAQT